jgi:hypothetical protein
VTTNPSVPTTCLCQSGMTHPDTQDLLAISKLIPTLRNRNSSEARAWSKGIKSYFTYKGYTNLFNGEQPEPYRIPGSKVSRHPVWDTLVPPQGPHGPGSVTGEGEDKDGRRGCTSATGKDLTKIQKAEWDIWADKERKARVVVFKTVSEDVLWWYKDEKYADTGLLLEDLFKLGEGPGCPIA